MKTVTDALAGLGLAVHERVRLFAVAVVIVGVSSVVLPPLLLSVVRKPVDFFTINPWLRRLPEYLASSEHTAWTKIDKLSNLALFWFSADSPYGGTEWGFAVDVRDVARIALTSLLVGAYFALWSTRRAAIRGTGGIAGALVSVAGLTTGPCSVAGCGAPVLPVVGLAFTGLSSGALKLLAGVSSVATTTIVAVLVVAVAYLSWRVGAERRRPRAADHR